MTKFLTELITEKTPVLNLKNNSNITNEEKNNVLNLDCSLSNIYIRKMYYCNNLW